MVKWYYVGEFLRVVFARKLRLNQAWTVSPTLEDVSGLLLEPAGFLTR